MKIIFTLVRKFLKNLISYKIPWKTLEFPRYRPWKIEKNTLENPGKPWNLNSDFGWESWYRKSNVFVLQEPF